MVTTQRNVGSDQQADAAYVPPIDAEELTRRNAAAVALLRSWVVDGDEQEQRETMAVLREALGERRIMSNRPALR